MSLIALTTFALWGSKRVFKHVDKWANAGGNLLRDSLGLNDEAVVPNKPMSYAEYVAYTQAYGTPTSTAAASIGHIRESYLRIIDGEDKNNIARHMAEIYLWEYRGMSLSDGTITENKNFLRDMDAILEKIYIEKYRPEHETLPLTLEELKKLDSEAFERFLKTEISDGGLPTPIVEIAATKLKDLPNDWYSLPETATYKLPYGDTKLTKFERYAMSIVDENGETIADRARKVPYPHQSLSGESRKFHTIDDMMADFQINIERTSDILPRWMKQKDIDDKKKLIQLRSALGISREDIGEREVRNAYRDIAIAYMGEAAIAQRIEDEYRLSYEVATGQKLNKTDVSTIADLRKLLVQRPEKSAFLAQLYALEIAFSNTGRELTRMGDRLRTLPFAPSLSKIEQAVKFPGFTPMNPVTPEEINFSANILENIYNRIITGEDYNILNDFGMDAQEIAEMGGDINKVKNILKETQRAIDRSMGRVEAGKQLYKVTNQQLNVNPENSSLAQEMNQLFLQVAQLNRKNKAQGLDLVYELKMSMGIDVVAGQPNMGESQLKIVGIKKSNGKIINSESRTLALAKVEARGGALTIRELGQSGYAIGGKYTMNEDGTGAQFLPYYEGLLPSFANWFEGNLNQWDEKTSSMFQAFSNVSSPRSEFTIHDEILKPLLDKQFTPEEHIRDRLDIAKLQRAHKIVPGMEYVILDTETTGIVDAKVLSVGMTKVRFNKTGDKIEPQIISSDYFVLNNNETLQFIDDEVMKTLGFDPKQQEVLLKFFRDYGISDEAAAKRIDAFTHGTVGIIGQNITKFDIPLIKKQFFDSATLNRHGGDFMGLPVIDLLATVTPLSRTLAQGGDRVNLSSLIEKFESQRKRKANAAGIKYVSPLEGMIASFKESLLEKETLSAEEIRLGRKLSSINAHHAGVDIVVTAQVAADLMMQGMFDPNSTYGLLADVYLRRASGMNPSLDEIKLMSGVAHIPWELFHELPANAETVAHSEIQQRLRRLYPQSGTQEITEMERIYHLINQNLGRKLYGHDIMAWEPILAGYRAFAGRDQEQAVGQLGGNRTMAYPRDPAVSALSNFHNIAYTDDASDFVHSQRGYSIGQHFSENARRMESLRRATRSGASTNLPGGFYGFHILSETGPYEKLGMIRVNEEIVKNGMFFMDMPGKFTTKDKVPMTIAELLTGERAQKPNDAVEHFISEVVKYIEKIPENNGKTNAEIVAQHTGISGPTPLWDKACDVVYNRIKSEIASKGSKIYSATHKDKASRIAEDVRDLVVAAGSLLHHSDPATGGQINSEYDAIIKRILVGQNGEALFELEYIADEQHGAVKLSGFGEKGVAQLASAESLGNAIIGGMATPVSTAGYSSKADHITMLRGLSQLAMETRGGSGKLKQNINTYRRYMIAELDRLHQSEETRDAITEYIAGGKTPLEKMKLLNALAGGKPIGNEEAINRVLASRTDSLQMAHVKAFAETMKNQNYTYSTTLGITGNGDPSNLNAAISQIAGGADKEALRKELILKHNAALREFKKARGFSALLKEYPDLFKSLKTTATWSEIGSSAALITMIQSAKGVGFHFGVLDRMHISDFTPTGPYGHKGVKINLVDLAGQQLFGLDQETDDNNILIKMIRKKLNTVDAFLLRTDKDLVERPLGMPAYNFFNILKEGQNEQARDNYNRAKLIRIMSGDKGLLETTTAIEAGKAMNEGAEHLDLSENLADAAKADEAERLGISIGARESNYTNSLYMATADFIKNSEDFKLAWMTGMRNGVPIVELPGLGEHGGSIKMALGLGTHVDVNPDPNAPKQAIMSDRIRKRREIFRNYTRMFELAADIKRKANIEFPLNEYLSGSDEVKAAIRKEIARTADPTQASSIAYCLNEIDSLLTDSKTAYHSYITALKHDIAPDKTGILHKIIQQIDVQGVSATLKGGTDKVAPRFGEVVVTPGIAMEAGIKAGEFALMKANPLIGPRTLLPVRVRIDEKAEGIHIDPFSALAQYRDLDTDTDYLISIDKASENYYPELKKEVLMMTQRRYKEGYEAAEFIKNTLSTLLITPANIASNPHVSDQTKSMFTKYKAMQRLKSGPIGESPTGKFEDVRKSIAYILDRDDYKYDMGGDSKHLVNIFDMADDKILQILANPDAEENAMYMDKFQRGWEATTVGLLKGAFEEKTGHPFFTGDVVFDESGTKYVIPYIRKLDSARLEEVRHTNSRLRNKLKAFEDVIGPQKEFYYPESETIENVEDIADKRFADLLDIGLPRFFNEENRPFLESKADQIAWLKNAEAQQGKINVGAITAKFHSVQRTMERLLKQDKEGIMEATGLTERDMKAVFEDLTHIVKQEAIRGIKHDTFGPESLESILMDPGTMSDILQRHGYSDITSGAAAMFIRSALAVNQNQKLHLGLGTPEWRGNSVLAAILGEKFKLGIYGEKHEIVPFFKEEPKWLKEENIAKFGKLAGGFTVAALSLRMIFGGKDGRPGKHIRNKIIRGESSFNEADNREYFEMQEDPFEPEGSVAHIVDLNRVSYANTPSYMGVHTIPTQHRAISFSNDRLIDRREKYTNAVNPYWRS